MASQRLTTFINHTDQLIAVRLTTTIRRQSYVKQESSLSNAHKYAHSNYTNTLNKKLNTNSSSNTDDQSREFGVEAGGKLNAAVEAVVSIGGGISAGLGKLIGGPSASVEGNGSASGKGKAGGGGMLNINYDKTDAKTQTCDTLNHQNDEKTNAVNQMNKNSQSCYQFTEAHNKWIETKVGYSKIEPAGIVQIPIETANETQGIYMTIFVGDMSMPICDASPVSSKEVIIEYNQQLNMYLAKPNYHQKFMSEMFGCGLGTYVDVMQNVGLDDTANWIYLTEDDLMKDLKFTKWHLRTFVRMAHEKFHIKFKNITCINDVEANLYQQTV